MTDLELIAKLINERDEARRMYCKAGAVLMYKSYGKSSAEHIAESKGWDCYKKEETK